MPLTSCVDVRPSGPHEPGPPLSLPTLSLWPCPQCCINSCTRAEQSPRPAHARASRNLAAHPPVLASLRFVPLLDSHPNPEPSVCCCWLSFSCSDLSWVGRGNRVSRFENEEREAPAIQHGSHLPTPPLRDHRLGPGGSAGCPCSESHPYKIFAPHPLEGWQHLQSVPNPGPVGD